MGALKTLSREHGEIKSMYTAERARHQGVGQASAQAYRLRSRAPWACRASVWRPALGIIIPPGARLYRRHGFVECAPFADYKSDPNSVFMTCGALSPDHVQPGAAGGNA